MFTHQVRIVVMLLCPNMGQYFFGNFILYHHYPFHMLLHFSFKTMGRALFEVEKEIPYGV